jgi:hypothetical protein
MQNEYKKQELLILKKINNLPEEIINIIFLYVNEKVKIFLTKKEYIEKHQMIKKYIDRQKYEEYIRYIIRKDNDFVFKRLLFENFGRWLQMKKYYDKGLEFLNYFYFIRSYCSDNEAIKCKNIIDNIIIEQGLSKNLHKKKIIQYIKWKT